MSTTFAESRTTERTPALDPLLRRIEVADGILQREKGARRVLRAWPWIFGYVVAAFTLDVLLHFAAGPRAALLVGWILLVVGVLAGGAWIAWMRRSAPEHTARVLEERDPALGSKLINVLQLRAQSEDARLGDLTRELAGMAVAGYAADLEGVNLAAVARTDRVKRDAWQLARGAGGFLAVLAIFYPITKTELPRFLDPWGDHPPYSFTEIDIADPGDDSAVVVYGQSLIVTARTRGHRPGELFLTTFAPDHPKARTTLPMFDKGEHGFSQQIEGIKTNLVIFAHTRNEKSTSRQRRIAVLLTPKLEKAFVKVAPPAYTGLPPEERTLQFKTLKALQGSAITFRLQSNRPLVRGDITVLKAEGPAEMVAMESAGGNEVVGTMTAQESAQLKFSITDRDGFASQETWELALTVTHDLPPDVQITNPTGDTFVAMDVKVEPVIEAADDYGLKTVRIHQAHNGVFVEPRTVAYDKPTLNAREGLTFDLLHMDLESGDTLSIFAEAIDNAPEPHIARSKTVTLTVISTEEYNQFLRERTDMSDIEAKYAKLFEEFHDLVDEQKKLEDEAEALRKQLAAAATEEQKAALQKKLDDLMARQQQLDQKLKQLAETMENFVRDKPLYDVEADLKNTLAEKAQEIRDSAAANEQAMKDLAAANPPPGAPPQPGEQGAQPQKGGQAGLSPQSIEGFKQAADAQLQKLGATEQSAREEVQQPLEDLSLMHEIVKDMNRFKELYEAQKQLAEQTKAYDRPTPLSREDQIALKDLAAQEKAIGEELDTVEQKLWEDGKAAKEKFPKAGQSAQDLAIKMGDLRLQMMANQATAAMLDGKGAQGAQLAENLRSEMEKLFSQCNGQSGQMESELDSYLTMKRSMSAGKNFKQMMQTRKFGDGNKPGFGGQGNGGKDGYAIITGPNPQVMGNESSVTDHDRAKRDGPGHNKANPSASEAQAAIDKQDVVRGMQPVNRESEAVQGEAGLEQYSEIVDQYFKTITKPQPPKKP